MPPRLRHKLEARAGSNMPATTIILLGLFTVLRLGLVFGRRSLPPTIANVLHSPALASVSINSLYTVEHLREGIFLLDRSGAGAACAGLITVLDAAYEGSVFHLPPLILALFRPLFHATQSETMQDIIVGVMLVFADLVVAILVHYVTVFATCNINANAKREARLEQKMDDKIRPKRAWIFGLDTWEKKKSTEQGIKEPVVQMTDIPQLCCLMYYCNPVAILVASCAPSPSFQGVINMFILIAVRMSILSNTIGAKRRAILSTLSLAFAAYMEPYHVVYLIPVSILIGRSNGGGSQLNRGLVVTTIASFFFWFGLLHAVSTLFVEDYATVWAKTYGYVHGFFDMSPNMGLSWYFFIQMFDRFRRYFVAMFTLLQFIFVAPLTIRLRDYPIVLTTAFFLLGTLFKPLQTLYDAALGLALVAMEPRTVSRMGNASLVSIFAMVVPATLVVVFYWLWLETGTGNANYMFFQCLAYNVFLSIITLDYISATSKRDKALRLTEKLDPQGGNAINKDKSN
jgi:phosphatidylinositol glycan class U